MTSPLAPYLIALAGLLVGATIGLMAGCILAAARDPWPPPGTGEGPKAQTIPVPTRTRQITLADVLAVTPKQCYDVPLHVRLPDGRDLRVDGVYPEIDASERHTGFVLHVSKGEGGE